MGVKLLDTEETQETRMCDLEDGKLALVLDSDYKGTIVQRFGNTCIAIGKPKVCSWSCVDNNNLLVRVLKAGELIEVQESNELF